MNVSCSFLPIEVKYSWFQTFAVFCMLFCFFWVILRRLSFNCRRFGTLCLFHLHRRADVCRMNWVGNIGVYTERGLARTIAWAIRKEGGGVGAGQEQNRLWRVAAHKGPGLVSKGDRGGGSHYCVTGGCLFSLSLCSRGFHDLLKVRPSSLLTCLWRWNRQSVPKRRQLKLRRRGITQKKQYNKKDIVVVEKVGKGEK
jgi:hypothetical protein